MLITLCIEGILISYLSVFSVCCRVQELCKAQGRVCLSSLSDKCVDCDYIVGTSGCKYNHRRMGQKALAV